MNCNSEDHKKHFCYLKTHGMEDCLKSITDKPTVECSHCGARVNGVEYVCAAHLGSNAPSVEGGHGSIGLDEVGKPHAG